MSVPVPTRSEDLTPQWLTSFLQTRHPEAVVDDLEIIESTQGAATRVRIRPTYAAGHDAGLPPVLFVKTSLTTRMLVADPHMYLTEVRFYERLRDTLDCETPQVFASVFDDETYRFAVAIEDLSLRSARFPSAVSGLTAEDLVPLMTTLARLHSTNWGHHDLEQRYDWLETASRGKSATWWLEEGADLVRVELEVPYKRAVFEGGGQPVERLFAGIESLQSLNDAEPRTVTHGDTHIGNCYLLPDGTGGLLDWQLMRVANWGNDVAYTVMTALDVEERRRGERDLLQVYLDELGRLGVAVPDWDHAWDLYRSQAVWGIYAFLVTPTEMYDQERLEAIVHRCVVAAEDLETYESLGV